MEGSTYVCKGPLTCIEQRVLLFQKLYIQIMKICLQSFGSESVVFPFALYKRED
jgi:hypothetical protein